MNKIGKIGAERLKGLSVILLLLVAVVGCHHRATNFTYVLPNGFNGLFLISEDKVSGVELKQVDGHYTVEIPPDGHLKVKNFEVLLEWQKMAAKFKTESEIPVDIDSGPSQSTMFALGFQSGSGLFYFVGTRSGYFTVKKAFDLSKLPLAQRIE